MSLHFVQLINSTVHTFRHFPNPLFYDRLHGHCLKIVSAYLHLYRFLFRFDWNYHCHCLHFHHLHNFIPQNIPMHNNDNFLFGFWINYFLRIHKQQYCNINYFRNIHIDLLALHYILL